MNHDHSLNHFYFINCYIKVILLTNIDTKLEQTMFIIEHPETHGLVAFSE